jgi:hypothetical protein
MQFQRNAVPDPGFSLGHGLSIAAVSSRRVFARKARCNSVEFPVDRSPRRTLRSSVGATCECNFVCVRGIEQVAPTELRFLTLTRFYRQDTPTEFLFRMRLHLIEHFLNRAFLRRLLLR